MVSVRRVAPILLLAVTVPVWAQAPTSTTSTSAASTTTQATPKKKTTKKAAAKPAPASTTTSSTSTGAPAMTPAETTTSATTATTTSGTTTTTKKTAAKKPKKSSTKAATKKEAAPSTEKKATTKTAAKSTHPPRELHKVGDHWTAYNPPDPSTYPAGAKTYAIKQGDTLWALGKQFYNNAYLWPQIWEANTWITDAHWIYPGDVLLLEGEIQQQATTQGGGGTTATTGTGTTGTGTTEGQQYGGQQPGVGTALGAPSTFHYMTAADAVGGSVGPVALATEKDLYCYGYIGDPGELFANRISGWEDVEVRYQPGATRQEIDGSEGDLVFVDGGTATGLVAGETYILVIPHDLVPHPVTKQVLGLEYEYRGQIKILCADANKSRGIITQSCAEIPIGAFLKPLPQLPIPLARIPSLPAFCDPASGKTNGYIVASQGGSFLESLGEGQLIGINLGRDDQVNPGEFLTVFRDEQAGSPERQVLGEIAVLTAEGHTATARIVLMRRSMHIGDRVEVR